MQLSNTYIHLGEQFYKKSTPTPVQQPKLFLWNTELAKQLQIPKNLQDDPNALAQFFSGNRILAGSEPIASAYAGHQFGHFNPQLGDGRAHLLGEVTGLSGASWDIQLKGSGPTPYSRGGDGRCAIGPALREFIMSEAMHALHVPTTRCLAVVTTGEPVYRETVAAGAVVTRIASSHLRVGNFQLFAARGDLNSIQILCDYAIQKHFPELKETPHNKFVMLLDAVIKKQIQLITQWMRVGFIHGVMNTDNTAISGDTIDYGPCAMVGVYNPATVYSSIDRNGRYAFGNQANIAHWNIARFAECLLPLISETDTQNIKQIETLVNDFSNQFNIAYLEMMAGKLGLLTVNSKDSELINAFLAQLQKQALDYTHTFNLLTQSLTQKVAASQLKFELAQVFTQWQDRVKEQNATAEKIQTIMQQHNPIVIPRNHHIESVIKAYDETGTAKAAEEFLEVIRSPYNKTENTEKFQTQPVDNDVNYKTFCGT